MNNLKWLVLSSFITAAFLAMIWAFFALVLKVVVVDFESGQPLSGVASLLFLLFVSATSLNVINHWINLLRNKQ